MSGIFFILSGLWQVAVPTPKLKRLDKLLTHCHRRRYTRKEHHHICPASLQNAVLHHQGFGHHHSSRDDDGRGMIIGYLNGGDFFGELGLFGRKAANRERSASGSCQRWNARVAEISYAKFRELSQQGLRDPSTLGSQMADRPAQDHPQGGRPGLPRRHRTRRPAPCWTCTPATRTP